MANYPLGKVIDKKALVQALKFIGGGAALAGGAELFKTKKNLSKTREDLEKANKAKEIIANEYINSKNRELALDKALRAANIKDGIRTRAFGVIGGGTLGGLGGYGLTSLMTKNKWLRALGGLAGGAAGAVGGDYLAFKDYYAKHASQASNSRFVKNVYIPYMQDTKPSDNVYNPNKVQKDLLKVLMNTNDELNSALRERDFYKNTLGYAAGSTLGGLGGYGLTSLMTKNKWLRALGALAGGAAGAAGVNYAYNRGNLDDVLSNGMNKLKSNKFIKSITSNPKVQSAINYFKQEK